MLLIIMVISTFLVVHIHGERVVPQPTYNPASNLASLTNQLQFGALLASEGFEEAVDNVLTLLLPKGTDVNVMWNISTAQVDAGASCSTTEDAIGDLEMALTLFFEVPQSLMPNIATGSALMKRVSCRRLPIALFHANPSTFCCV